MWDETIVLEVSISFKIYKKIRRMQMINYSLEMGKTIALNDE